MRIQLVNNPISDEVRWLTYYYHLPVLLAETLLLLLRNQSLAMR